MGVPALFRWLSQKYPKIISSVVEERPRVVDGAEIPVDTTKPNPNGQEYDNLYLDMNGIIHPCSHPEDRPPPATEEEMMLEVFKFADRVVNMVRPRKVLMLAIDGVAPRAKMNQQRSRRFRSAQEAKAKDEEKVELLKLLRQQNNGILPENLQEEMSKKTWDSNSITPGTPFMDTLAISLQYWTAYKLNTDPAWEKLKIILSDASVPGEGEHKIMEFIRSQRSSPEHDPNTRHVICGLDADLIMLGLATHEPHFHVLREDVFFQEGKNRTCRICGQSGHIAENCRGETKKKQGEFDEKAVTQPAEKPFIWLHVSVLREYLAVEMNVPNCGFKFDLERALDDWVFMCFFVGNDFLPHLPSLEIRDQAIDTLIAIWRDNLPVMGGYVTKDGFMNYERAQTILEGLAKQEDAIFRRRHQVEERRNAGAKRRKLEEDRKLAPRRSGESAPHDGGGLNLIDLDTLRDNTKSYRDGTLGASTGITHQQVVNRGSTQKANEANKSAAAVLKERLLSRPSSDASATVNEESAQDSKTTAPTDNESDATAGDKRKRAPADEADEAETANEVETPAKADPDEPPPDDIRLWSPGYADRYYEKKFHVSKYDHEFRHKVASSYAEGLAWVLLYYFQGCPSWTWYYPYHYAPFAADFQIAGEKSEFKKGKPFRPFEQLMGVLPAASNHAIPEVFRSLMTDDDSDILEFYPETFPIDLNGKKFAWQGVAILPFIDADRLLKAMGERYLLLSDDEKRRNQLGRDTLFFSDRHPLYETVASHFYSKKPGAATLVLNQRISEGLAGQLEKNEAYLPQSSLIFPLSGKGMPDLDEDRSINLYYEFPKSESIHKSMILRGVKFPAPALDEADIQATKGLVQRGGRSHGGAPLYNHNGRGRVNYAGNNNHNNSHHHHHHHQHQQNGGWANKSQGNSESRPNPFAAHLNPSFFPNGAPPPGVTGFSGGYPQAPPHFPTPAFTPGTAPSPAMPMHGGAGYGYHSQHQHPQQQQGHQYDQNYHGYNHGHGNHGGSQQYRGNYQNHNGYQNGSDGGNGRHQGNDHNGHRQGYGRGRY